MIELEYSIKSAIVIGIRKMFKTLKPEVARMAGGRRIGAVKDKAKNHANNQLKQFESIMKYWQVQNVNAYILNAKMIDPVTQKEYKITMGERAQYISSFNLFYLPRSTISDKADECENMVLFHDDEIGLKKKSEKKNEETFKKQMTKEVKDYKLKYKNVTVEFTLDRDSWWQTNAEIYSAPNGGYLIYGNIVMRNNNKTASEKVSNEIFNGIEDSVAMATETIPELVESKNNNNNNDIDLIMQQTGSTREQAVVALKNNNNDLVNAILQLSDGGSATVPVTN